MTIRRRRLWLVMLAGLALAGGVWVWALGVAITTKSADRITNGMTRQQVYPLLGGPPNFTGYSIIKICDSDTYGYCAESWEVCDGSVTVIYGDDSKVVHQMILCQGLLPTQIRRLRNKLGY